MSHMSSLFRVASCQSGSFFGRFDSDHLSEPVHYGLNHGEEMCLAEKGSSYLEGNAGPVDSMHFFAWHCLHFVNPWKSFFFWLPPCGTYQNDVIFTILSTDFVVFTLCLGIPVPNPQRQVFFCFIFVFTCRLAVASFAQCAQHSTNLIFVMGSFQKHV